MTQQASQIQRPAVSAPGPWSFPEAQGATLANGFGGDPLRPLTGRQYGHLVAARAY